VGELVGEARGEGERVVGVDGGEERGLGPTRDERHQLEQRVLGDVAEIADAEVAGGVGLDGDLQPHNLAPHEGLRRAGQRHVDLVGEHLDGLLPALEDATVGQVLDEEPLRLVVPGR